MKKSAKCNEDEYLPILHVLREELCCKVQECVTVPSVLIMCVARPSKHKSNLCTINA